MSVAMFVTVIVTPGTAAPDASLIVPKIADVVDCAAREPRNMNVITTADAFPSLQRRGGCAISKRSRSHRSGADGVVSSAKCFRPEDFAELFFRLRPIGLALRATPSAPFKGGNFIISP